MTMRRGEAATAIDSSRIAADGDTANAAHEVSTTA